MNYKIRTLALLLLTAAAGNSAKAQQAQTLPPNKSYTFSSDTAATGSGNITYQWYRDGIAIEGATSASYSLPANLAQGVNVEFKRGAMSSNCSGEVTFSNIFYVSFCGILVGSTCWASTNAGTARTFMSRPDELNPYFQWNKAKAWAITGTAIGWDSIPDPTMNNWSSANNPCPDGWTVPSLNQFKALDNVGSTWAYKGTRGNAVAGRFCGTNHDNPASCTLPSPMIDCIFLAAAGNRNYANGEANSQGNYGSYHTSWAFSASNADIIGFNNSSFGTLGNMHKAFGFSIRCVR